MWLYSCWFHLFHKSLVPTTEERQHSVWSSEILPSCLMCDLPLGILHCHQIFYKYCTLRNTVNLYSGYVHGWVCWRLSDNHWMFWLILIRMYSIRFYCFTMSLPTTEGRTHRVWPSQFLPSCLMSALPLVILHYHQMFYKCCTMGHTVMGILGMSTAVQ